MRILYATDTHFNGKSGPHYPRSHIAFPLFVEEIRRQRDSVDRIVVSGDCVNRGSARIDDLECFREELEGLGLPYHVVAGNHDLAPSREYAAMYPGMEDWEEKPLIETNFGRVFGERGLRDSFEAEGLRILLLTLRDEDPDGQLEWLEAELADGADTLVFCHYPVVQSRAGGFCADWGYRRIGAVRSRLTDAVDNGQSRVLAYFCGHQHINSRVRRNATEHVVTGATGSSPYCYRTIEIRPRDIQIRTHRLPDIPSGLSEAMNPDRSEDADHTDMASYHWGNPDERDFLIRRLPPSCTNLDSPSAAELACKSAGVLWKTRNGSG